MQVHLPKCQLRNSTHSTILSIQTYPDISYHLTANVATFSLAALSSNDKSYTPFGSFHVVVCCSIEKETFGVSSEGTYGRHQDAILYPVKCHLLIS